MTTKKKKKNDKTPKRVVNDETLKRQQWTNGILTYKKIKTR